ncbi:PRMT10 [Auxenochlorella protothecoides x Auxenochlorella symbiontica]
MAARGGAGRAGSKLDGAAPDSTDMANYFITYSYLYHQKDMLEDHKRTGAYYNACIQNMAQFKDKVVLDVGTGSGILAIFAARAGARKVYAVEATDMAKHARRLVAAQGLAGTVEVIQGVIESVELPEQVDIIISEWMGYFLLRESMLDSVLVARNKFLKPGGALYPSHARMFLAPITTNQTQRRQAELEAAVDGWSDFVREVKQYYDVDMSCLTEAYQEEQADYFSRTAAWADVHPSQALGPPACLKSYDLLTLTLEELKADLQATFKLRLLQPGPVEALAGYFDVQFRGSPENPADSPVTLTTAPDPTGATHWGQQVFFMHPGIQADEGNTIEGSLSMSRRSDNHRLMDVVVKHKVITGLREGQERTDLFHIE